MGSGVGPQLQGLLQEAVLDPGLGERGRQTSITPLMGDCWGLSLIP